ncbi:MAG TPA: hypothetical protein VGD45_17895 [Steroidobacter sp.]|uniref:hypothetical protein n=1 Tax=Steroidobacter sp. TaxID=1978227 RepID=UPI002ED8B840
MQRPVPTCLRPLLLVTLAVAALFTAAARSQTTTASAGWLVLNQAHASYLEHPGAPSVALSSNVTQALVPLEPPHIQWYNDAGFSRQATVADHGQSMYVQVTSDGCDVNSQSVDHVRIVISTDVSLDEEIYDGVETAADTGIYRIVGPVRLAGRRTATVQHNEVLESSLQDVVQAWVDGCGSGTASDSLLIDPAGILFDSQTNEPISGATVRLIDVTGAGNGGFPGGAAVVFGFDGVTRLPSEVVTSDDGTYQFPLVAPSVYRLIVTPPGDYRFPSTAGLDELAVSRLVRAGSHGQDFEVNVDTGTVFLDIPLDSPADGLFLQKKASRDAVEIADTLQYTVVMRNTSGLDLSRLTLTDSLPPGFSYLKNSARLDGVAIADPSGGKGPILEFPLETLEATDRTLTYRVAVGPGAHEGDGVNRAVLRSSSPARKVSNTASAAVKVEGGVFDDRAYVLGKIFADCNANSVQDAGEPGLPRVRLYMEDGSFVISDNEGKYSFYGVSPRTHVLKVDATTLPANVTLMPISQRHARDGNSQFIDIHRSEMHRADFAVGPCSDSLMRALAPADDPSDTAESNSNTLGRELNLGLKNELKPAGEANVGDTRGVAASGIIGDTTQKPTYFANTSAVVAMAETARGATLQARLAGIDNSADFVGLIDGDRLGTRQITVVVKGPAGSTFDLKINDRLVTSDRVGTRIVDNQRKIEAWELIGVELNPGRNSLQLVQRDPFGNAREIREISLIAPDQMARINVSVPTAGVPADGEHVAHVRIDLKDEHDVVVAARTPVTLESTLGTWDIGDLDPNEPGTQIFVEGGQAQFPLRSPTTPGTAIILATSGHVSAETHLNFVPALRPLVSAGLIEGTLDLSKFDMNALTPARREDGFAQELRQFSARNGELTGGARAALFLKGKVRGDYLLTLGYDSDKDSRERLFRDIQPDRFYPVYGDSSVKGYDAQSTSRLYVRIDKDRSYWLAGDFTTQSLSLERKLGAYNRSLTGINERYQRGPIAIDAFASHDNARQVVEEIPANGTSGPFFLSNTSALENSEQVEIVTRDRDQPAVILSAIPQQRFTDYEIEPLTGRILFRAPIPSVDQHLNPVSIRITYEAEQGGEDFWTTGVDAQVQLNKVVKLGAAVIDDQNPEEERRIYSTNATFTLGKHTQLVGEIAHTRPGDAANGNGQRLELLHDGADLQLRAFASHTDAEFDNPSSYLSANREEAGAKASYSITERLRILGEALHSADVTNDASRRGGLFGIEQSFSYNIKGEVGLRRVNDESATGETSNTTSVSTRLTTPLPFFKRAALFGEYEQDIAVSDNKVVAAGGEYRLAGRSRLYARHEFISSLAGPYELDPSKERNTTVFGVDTSYLTDNHVFSEYRIADALSGREAQAAIGLRNGWQLARGVRIHTTAERVDALDNASQNETSALTGALEYTRNSLWKGTARLELRDASNGDGLLSTFGLASKLSDEWTFLGRNAYALTRNDSQDDRAQERLQLGFAYRDSDTNRVNGLWRYELKTEEGVEIDVKRVVHIFSTHMDYQYAGRTLVRGQYSTKLAHERTAEGRYDTRAHLVGGRVTRDVGSRFDIGAHVRALMSESFSSGQGGVGAELGFLMMSNLWLSAGYNVLGFRDDDLAGDEYTRRGAYLRMRFKFDESLLGQLQ